MAGVSSWVAGARPQTLPAAVVPVLAGTAVAVAVDGAIWWRAALALFLALALQVGVNYANDYSDGIRGTDTERVGPTRLVASRQAAPRAVLAAALGCFTAAALAGLVLAAVTSWWLVAVGIAAIAAAWFYTGGSRPYGYRGLGEVAVFVFFGLVAVVGTAFVQLEHIGWLAVAVSVPVGLLACALLVVNNLRDLGGDTRSGKRTLAVLLGDRRTRWLYTACLVLPFACAAAVGVAYPLTLLALLTAPLAAPPVRRVLHGATGAALVVALRETGRVQLAYGILLALGLMLS